MRIATSQFQSTMQRSLELNQTMVSRLMEQLATGKALLVPSDDPVKSVRISRLNREEAIIGQYRENIGAVKVRLSKNETYMSGMVGDLAEAHDLLVWAADGSNTPDDLKSMVTSLESLRESLMYTANTRDQEGKYLFSGTQTGTPPIRLDADTGEYVYDGNSGEQKVIVGNGVSQAVNVNVGGVETLLNQLNVVIDGLKNASGSGSSEPELRQKITDTMNLVESTQNDLAGKIATLGGAQNILTTLDTNHANVSLSNSTAMTDLAQVDIGIASTQLAGYNLALQATYQSYSKVSGLSLFNVL